MNSNRFLLSLMLGVSLLATGCGGSLQQGNLAGGPVQKQFKFHFINNAATSYKLFEGHFEIEEVAPSMAPGTTRDVTVTESWPNDQATDILNFIVSKNAVGIVNKQTSVTPTQAQNIGTYTFTWDGTNATLTTSP